MINKNNILHFSFWVIACCCLYSSCVSLEEYNTDGEYSDTIEFIARQISYDGHTVQTKATSVNNFESQIHNCYFLLFNASGDKVYGPVDLNATLTPQRITRHELLSKLGTVNTTCTACFIANVPSSTVGQLSTLTDVNNAVLNIDYSSSDVEDTGNSNKSSFFLIPEFDLDGDGTATQCLPMFGMVQCDLSNSNKFQVSLKRLFAKVSVTIGVNASGASFDILAAHLLNLPTKVKLVESGNESAWVKNTDAFMQQQIEGPIDDDNISGGVAGYLTNAYEFYFYVPEYCLSPTDDKSGNFGNQKYKPNMYDKDKFPVQIKLFGKYKASLSSPEQDVTYDLYLGENASTSFTLRRNMFYKNLVKINGITNSKDGEGATLDCRVDVSKLDEIEVLGQTANCYIIGKTGTYIYPACKGVWKGGLSNIPESLKCTRGTTLKILYQDNDGIKLENLSFNPESCEFSFDVTAIDEGTGLIVSNDGNIILGLAYTEKVIQDGKEVEKERIEWSWHLWFVNGAIMGVDAFEVESDVYPSNKSLMDRNLGARVTALFKSTPGVADGLYYKYGHKEPFVNNDYGNWGASDEYTWNDTEKTQTDPCPPGYRVPQSSAWSGEATKEHATIPNVVEALRFWDMDSASNIFDDIYYPYSGYIDANKQPQSQGYGQRVTTKDYSVNIPENQSNLGYLTAQNYTDNADFDPKDQTGPVKFTEVSYSRYDITNLGILSAQDKEVRYGFKEKGIDIISCKVEIGKWSKSGFLNPKYTANYNSFGGPKKLTGDQLKSQYEKAYNRLIAAIDGGSGSNLEIAWDALSGLFIAPTSSFDFYDIDKSNGYQVRCVKE